MHEVAVQFEDVVDAFHLDLGERVFVQWIHVKSSLTVRATPRMRGGWH